MFQVKNENVTDTKLNKIEALMVKNMLKDEQKQLADLTAEELQRLPKPQQVIQSAKGHVHFKKLNSSSVIEQVKLQLQNITCSKEEDLILVLGHSKSGLELLLAWLHVHLGLFVLYENSTDLSAKEILYSLTNLSNCAIIHHGSDHFNLHHSPFKFNSFILDLCSNDSKCLTSPSLWSQVCTLFPGKILASASTQQMAEVKNANKLLYLHKDPRSSLNPNSASLAKEASDLCLALEHDLKQIDQLTEAGQRPKMLRYEDFTIKPQEALSEALGIHNCHQQNVTPKQQSEKDWRLQLSMDQVLLIEDKCRHVLSRLEYPFVSS